MYFKILYTFIIRQNIKCVIFSVKSFVCALFVLPNDFSEYGVYDRITSNVEA